VVGWWSDESSSQDGAGLVVAVVTAAGEFTGVTDKMSCMAVSSSNVSSFVYCLYR